ncbi:hypothetical protein [Rhodococcus erythropolis]|uniref:hypothetical protein n=1 Tax=Rhodococcus erythropolis TaxID=1833 RepID=UPI003F67571E
MAHIDEWKLAIDEWKLAMPSTSNLRVELLIPDALPGFSARFNPAVLPPSNGFIAVQMDTRFRTLTMFESDHEVNADPPSPWPLEYSGGE